MDTSKLRKQVAQAVRTLAGGDILTLTVGHVSVRVPGKDAIVMLGHAHKAYKTLDDVTEEDIIVIDLDGNQLEGKHEPAGEKYIHTEIYKGRPDVNSIVHGHPEMSMAFGVAMKRLVPVYHRAVQFHPAVPIFDFWGQIDTPELGRRCLELMNGGLALILRGHGVIVAGDSLEAAGANAFALEKNAKIQYMAACLGAYEPVPLTPAERPSRPTSVWRYFVKTYDPKFDAMQQLF